MDSGVVEGGGVGVWATGAGCRTPALRAAKPWLQALTHPHAPNSHSVAFMG